MHQALAPGKLVNASCSESVLNRRTAD